MLELDSAISEDDSFVRREALTNGWGNISFSPYGTHIMSINQCAMGGALEILFASWVAP